MRSELLCSARLVNKMIDQLGGQAQAKGESGVWKELTESVNQMAGNLTAQVRNIAGA